LGSGGSGPGQFNLPPGIAIDRRGRVYVADRREQAGLGLSSEGEYLTQWTDTGRPMQICFRRAPNGPSWWRRGISGRDVSVFFLPAARSAIAWAYVSIFDLDGNLLSRWGAATDPCAPEDLLRTARNLRSIHRAGSTSAKWSCRPADIREKFLADVPFAAEVLLPAPGAVNAPSADMYTAGKFGLSFEIFPSKTPKASSRLLGTVACLARFQAGVHLLRPYGAERLPRARGTIEPVLRNSCAAGMWRPLPVFHLSLGDAAECAIGWHSTRDAGIANIKRCGVNARRGQTRFSRLPAEQRNAK